MFNFIKYLTEEKPKQDEEAKKGYKLKHATHLEDLALHLGHDGVHAAASHLEDLDKMLRGKKAKAKVSVKYDGAPSFVAGHHPETGQFFVASKSAFNKNPKLNFTDEDIERNHGHAPGLAKKLKQLLKHLPKVMPKKGVYQGDGMYTADDVHHEDGKYHFTPNTTQYSAANNSPEGKKIKSAKIGVVFHTKYEGKTLDDMEATPNVDRENFKHHPDVHNIDPSIDVSRTNYTPEKQRQYQNSVENARRAYGTIDPNFFEHVKGHEATIESHINDMVRKGKKPSTQGLIEHLTTKMKKDVDSVKTAAAKKRKQDEYAQIINKVSGNKKDFDKFFEMHGHLQKAKNAFIDAMNSSPPFEHRVNGELSGPEGFVSSRGGQIAKLVSREPGGFAQKNLTGAGKIHQAKQAAKQEQQPAAQPQAAKSKPEEKHHVMTFMRANPVHVGHEKLIKHGEQIAAQHGAKFNVVLSHSHDPKKNPLTPEQKLKHVKAAFPESNVTTSSSDMPSLLHHAAQAYKKGATHLHVVVGQDRVKQFKDLLDSYNDVKSSHGHYNFKKITVHSAGDRDPDADDIEGASATKMRQLASSNDKEDHKKFMSFAPSSMPPHEAFEMLHNVRNNMRGKQSNASNTGQSSNNVRSTMGTTGNKRTSSASKASNAKRNADVGTKQPTKRTTRRAIKEQTIYSGKTLFVEALIKSMKDKTNGSISKR